MQPRAPCPVSPSRLALRVNVGTAAEGRSRSFGLVSCGLACIGLACCGKCYHSLSASFADAQHCNCVVENMNCACIPRVPCVETAATHPTPRSLSYPMPTPLSLGFSSTWLSHCCRPTMLMRRLGAADLACPRGGCSLAWPRCLLSSPMLTAPTSQRQSCRWPPSSGGTRWVGVEDAISSHNFFAFFHDGFSPQQCWVVRM